MEEAPAPGVTPIKWLLRTTLSVQNFEQAICCIRWYTYHIDYLDYLNGI
jgi:hypothetical protein